MKLFGSNIFWANVPIAGVVVQSTMGFFSSIFGGSSGDHGSSTLTKSRSFDDLSMGAASDGVCVREPHVQDY